MPRWLASLQSASEFQCLVGLWCAVGALMVPLVATRRSSHDQTEPPPLRLLREVLAGGVAASLAELLFFPAEVIKVRLQTHGDAPDDASGSGSCDGSPADLNGCSGLLATAAHVWRTEGASGLWGSKGIVAANLRALSNQGLRLGLFPSIKRALLSVPLFGDGTGLGARVCAGMLAGALGAALTSPLDLAKINMAARATRHCFSNSLECLCTMAWAGGVRTLWTASGVGVARAMVASGAQLCAYDVAKGLELPSVLASAVAAVAYTTVAAPMDLVRTRLMSTAGKKGGKEARESAVTLALGVVAAVTRAGGVRGLWRGWGAATLSLIPVVALVFPVMEALRSTLGVGAF